MQSVFLSLFLDVLARFGWLRYFQVKLLSRIAPALADALRPSAITKMHDEAKFSFGYPRFVVPGAILIARLLRGHSWDTALYNLPSMAAFFVTLAVEFIEDFIVSRELCAYCPAPDPKFYEGIGNLDPGQLFVFEQRAGQNACPSKARETASHRTHPLRTGTPPSLRRCRLFRREHAELCLACSSERQWGEGRLDFPSGHATSRVATGGGVVLLGWSPWARGVGTVCVC